MSKHVQFEDENKGSFLYGHFERGTEPPGMVKLVMKTGIVKTPMQANLVLVGFIVLALAFTGYQVWSMVSGPETQGKPVYREDLAPQIKEKLSPDDLRLIPSRND